MTKKKPIKKTFIPLYAPIFRAVPSALKRFILRSLGAEISHTCIINKNTLIEGKINQLKIGKGVVIGKNCTIRIHGKMVIEDGAIIREKCAIGYGHTPEKNVLVKIGKNTMISPKVYIETTGGVEIGEHVIITGESVIFTHEHSVKKDILIQKQKIIPKYGTTIGNDVYIGYRSTILGGVIIEDGAVIGANSVITKNVNQNTIVAGVPARIIGHRE